MPERAYVESPEVRWRSVVAIVAGILVALVLIGFGFEAFFPDLIGKTYTVSKPFPSPRVIPNERDVRLALEARQLQALKGGNGRIPIDRAMADIAARGPHAYDPVRKPQ